MADDAPCISNCVNGEELIAATKSLTKRPAKLEETLPRVHKPAVVFERIEGSFHALLLRCSPKPLSTALLRFERTAFLQSAIYVQRYVLDVAKEPLL